MGLPGTPTEDLIAWAGNKLKRVRDAFMELGYGFKAGELLWTIGISANPTLN